MSKFLSLVLVLLVCAGFSGVAEGIDLDSMSAYELFELQLKVQEKLYEIDPASGFILYPGTYVVGRDLKAGLKLKKEDTSWPDDAQIAGKFYSLRNAGDTSQDHNCTRASVSYVLRRMGFDVEPKRIESSNPSGANVESILRVFKGSIPERVRVSSGSSIEARISLMKEIKSNYSDSSKAFGMVLIPRGPKGVAGHAMAFEKNGDNVVLLDPQSGGVGKVPKLFDHIANGYFSDNIILVRADDCGVDPDLVKDYVVNKIRA